MKKIAIQILIVMIVCVVAIYISYNRNITYEVEKVGIKTIGVVIKREPYFKGGPWLDYFYSVDNIKYTGSDSYDYRDKHKFELGDSIIVSYLTNRKKESRIVKDKNNNVILYVNKLQIDSLNCLQ
jgi:hypothetical protein